MDKIKPKLFSVMKTYSTEQLIKDIIAGIIVAIIALPLSIALALASGVGPKEGIFTAIIAGFVVSFFGGSRVQIAGPTAAFATIVAGIVAKNGMDGLVIATVMAGIILIIMGFCRMGSLISYIPATITSGFTLGIAITIALGQLKDFMGLTFKESPVETIEKVVEVVRCIGTFNYQALLLGLVSLAILVFWPKKLQKIPASLVAVIVAAAAVKLMKLEVNTIGDLYQVSSELPSLHIPEFSFDKITSLLPDAFTIAVLAGIESLLSCVVSDSMIGSKHRSNMELIAQGAGNIASALFGGIPATGALARTAANVRNGGRTPISGMVHSVVLLLIIVLLMPYAALIPMPAIAAILFVVAYNMSGWRTVLHQLKTSPKSDIIVLVTTLVLTVVFDIVVAIGIGFVLASLLFMKRMAEVTEVHGWVYADEVDEDDDVDSLFLKKVPKNVRVFEINGPMFFAASDKFFDVITDTSEDVLIIRMRSVPAIDATGVQTLETILEKCDKHNITVIFSHVNEQPMTIMHKAGFVDRVGKDNFCEHIDAALIRAEELIGSI
ncbi:MAG: STAS domain-containing protein [Lachnospiraceae bacterium]|nr:STAS domain-containing protein [Lachnospiraceae bacterium]